MYALHRLNARAAALLACCRRACTRQHTAVQPNAGGTDTAPLPHRARTVTHNVRCTHIPRSRAAAAHCPLVTTALRTSNPCSADRILSTHPASLMPALPFPFGILCYITYTPGGVATPSFLPSHNALPAWALGVLTRRLDVITYGCGFLPQATPFLKRQEPPDANRLARPRTNAVPVRCTVQPLFTSTKHKTCITGATGPHRRSTHVKEMQVTFRTQLQ